jgi:asparagine synthase (glutamine-hydrolysing)
MCGIAGMISRGPIDEELVARLGRPIAHRGPDDEGLWVDQEAGVGFAHRRLAIVDLSPAGHQPMVSSDGRFVLTFNGEIYNHSEIRRELDGKGLAPDGGWRGHSDTETFLEAILNWGLVPTLERCVGMFAFGLWDRRERKLSLVRDRFGEKPVYFGWAGRDFLFGSELKALRCHPRFSGEIDRRAVSLFARRGYIPAPLSIYRGIFKLEPGCFLTIYPSAAPLSEPLAPGCSSAGMTMTRYWDYRAIVRAGMEQPFGNEDHAVDELEQALSRSVSGQAMADVPVGAFLSGGIDSSTVVATYQKCSSQQVRTFTIGFDEQAYNEANDARAVAARLGTLHFERIVRPTEAQGVITKLPQLYDEPFGDSSQIPTYLVSAFAREHVKVALSGDGGDELFGGYNRYFASARLWSAARVLPRPVRSAAGSLLARIEPRAWDRIGQIALRGRAPPYFGVKVQKTLGTMAHARTIEGVLSSFLDEWSGERSPIVGVDEDPELCPFDLDVGGRASVPMRLMYCDAVSYLPDDILCKVDRAAMAVSLETRVPFLDHRLASVAARIPIRFKIRGTTGKHVLRKLLHRHAPSSLFDRPKAGFGIPVGDWLKGPLRHWAEDLLDKRALDHGGWVESQKVRKRWEQHLAGTRDSTAALWSMLMFQSWLQEQRQDPADSATQIDTRPGKSAVEPEAPTSGAAFPDPSADSPLSAS